MFVLAIVKTLRNERSDQIKSDLIHPTQTQTNLAQTQDRQRRLPVMSPYPILYPRVSLNSTVSCGTTPILVLGCGVCVRHHAVRVRVG
jgi:hypothetical protein